MSNLKSQIESLLFIASRPLSLKNISQLIGAGIEETEKNVKELIDDYDKRSSGIKIMRIGNNFQMSTSSANAKLIRSFLKDEMTGELTRPSLEALTIIAYRGPISKSELEQIRGVNCSLILRNLMIKGLIEEIKRENDMEPHYIITFNFMRHLGIKDVSELPDYEKLSKSEIFKKILEQPSSDKLTNSEIHV